MTNEEYLLIGLAFISGMFTGANLAHWLLSKITKEALDGKTNEDN